MIEINDLSKQFNNNFWAVQGVTLDVQPGQILALLGQNGAGKTTTVRMLTALLAPTRGYACVAGYDVTKNPKEVRMNVGVLTEQHGLYLRMTGSEYLGYFGKIYGLDAQAGAARSKYLLEYFGLAEASRRRSGEYSKGMKQKLALARSLIHNPSVLLLDELEKDHPDVFNLLLKVMDHGSLTDNNGRKADFRNIILVMTTNAGAEEGSRRLG